MVSVNHVTREIEPDKPPRSRPTSSLSEIGQDPQCVLDLARQEHIQQFWDSEPDRARELASLVDRPFVGIGNCSGASFVKDTEP